MDELRAFLFGATIAAAVGPIALLVIHTGMRHGLRAALAAACGVAAADFVYAVAAFAAGTGLAALIEGGRREFALAAGAVLLCVGLWLARGAMRARGGGGRDREPLRLGFAATFVLTLANPLTIVLFAGFSGQLALSANLPRALYFAAFIFAGSLPVQACYAFLGAFVREAALEPRVIRALNVASGAGVALFGLYGVLRAL